MIYKKNYREIMKAKMKEGRWNYTHIAAKLGVTRAAVAVCFSKRVCGPDVIKRICDVIGQPFKELIQ